MSCYFLQCAANIRVLIKPISNNEKNCYYSFKEVTTMYGWVNAGSLLPFCFSYGDSYHYMFVVECTGKSEGHEESIIIKERGEPAASYG